MIMKKKHLLLLIPILLLSSCKASPEEDIITSSFIAYDLVNEIVQDKLTYRNLVPWGSELHDFEPNARDVIAINNAKLFLYTTPRLETWVNNLVNNENAIALSALLTDSHAHAPAPLYKKEHAHDHSHEEGSGHFWTDPLTYIDLINEITTYFTAIDMENVTFYQQNAETYANEIVELHEELEQFLETLSNPKIYFAGHNALDAFTNRYGLTIQALSSGYSPSQDLTPRQLIELIEEIYEARAKYIYIEELAEPRVALQIKNELKYRYDYDVELLELHAYHNIAKEDAKKGVNYAAILRQNIANLKQGLSA